MNALPSGAGWCRWGAACALLAAILLLAPACSDDPILGPDDGERQGGGSYSAIERLSPDAQAPDSAGADTTTRPPDHNPERF